jgi:hypothetical protein
MQHPRQLNETSRKITVSDLNRARARIPALQRERFDGGVYVELEAVALSRAVPGGLRWVVDPIVRRTSRASIHVSLEKTGEAAVDMSRAAKNKKDNATATAAFLHDIPATRVQSGLLP